MSSPWKKRIGTILTIIVCIGVVLLAMAWLSGAFRRGQLNPGKIAQIGEPFTGQTLTIEPIVRPAEVELIGSIESTRRSTIASRLTAQIISIEVHAGDVVKKGDVLARLDDRDIRARVDQGKESLRAAESERDLAQRELNRLEPLYERGAASTTEVDQWRSRLEQGVADVARARSVIDELSVQLSDATILAPFDGVIIDRAAEPGDLTGAGTSILTMYDPKTLRLDVVVREAYIARLDDLRTKKHPLDILIQATGQRTKGSITQIVPAADPVSRSFIAKVDLADSKGLYPGMFGRLKIPVDQETIIEIPAGAIRDVGQLSLVSVVTNEGVQNRAVRLGMRANDRVEILAGLSAGERIALPQ